jgi:hypothetical protein
MPVEERFWMHRLRWRVRSAVWLWPAFAAAVAGDAALLHYLPPVNPEQQLPGGSVFGLIGDVIVASFGNLFLVAVVAPWLAKRLAARPPDPGVPPTPLEVLVGRAAAALMVAGAIGLLVVGLATRPLIVSETRATEQNARTVRDWVLSRGSAEMRRNLGNADTVRLSAGYFRTCIASDKRTRWFCFFVDTNVEPTSLERDPDTRPNREAIQR